MRQIRVMRKHPMKFFSLLFAIAIFPLISEFTQFEKDNNDAFAYIEKYKDVAIELMNSTGVPASIKLSQGILESGYGKSVLAREANNHFGMKCGSSWTGGTYYRKDDDEDPDGNIIKSCFRVFKDGEASYRAHSEFLRNKSRYDFLFELEITDYKRWALGLKKAGYATRSNYPDILIELIERYDLDAFDQIGNDDIAIVPVSDEEGEEMEIPGENLIVINSVEIALAEEEDSVGKISERTGISVKRILKYNENISSGYAALTKGEMVFLQPKRWGYRGEGKYHYVKKGETLFDISQKYAITVSMLKWRNRYNDGEQPALGEKIKLRGWKVAKIDAPSVRTHNHDEEEETRPATTLPVIDLAQDPDIEFNIDVDAITFDEIEVPLNTDDESADLDGHIHGDKTPSYGESDSGFEEEFPIKGEDFDYPEDESSDIEEVEFHVVEAGETLYRISKEHDITVNEIKELNDLTSNTLSIGQKLRLN